MIHCVECQIIGAMYGGAVCAILMGIAMKLDLL